jgi:glycosyltransferase involved in cell wall biosynthesis
VSDTRSVIIIGPAYPLRGGLAKFNERLAMEFQAIGIETHIYSFSLQYPTFLFPGKTQYSTEPPPDNLSIQVCINSINPFNWIKIGNRIRKLKPDIVVVRYWIPFMGPCLGTILRIVKANKHTKVTCIADNIIPHEKRMGDTLFTKYFVSPISTFITMSEKVKSDLKKFTTKTILQVNHPLYDTFGEKISQEVARKNLEINSNAFIFLFFGFIRKYKGLNLLFESIHTLKEKYGALPEKIQFLIAGEFYEDEKTYLDIIKKYDIQEFLILHTNFISDSQVAQYFSACNCVIQPYTSATQSGVTPLAYHFHQPLLVTNVGALPDMVPPSLGKVCKPEVGDLAHAIQEITNHKFIDLDLHFDEEKQKYSWKKLTHQIING